MPVPNRLPVVRRLRALRGMTFQVLCSNAQGATTLATLTPQFVVPLNNGCYRLEFTRPGEAAGSHGLHLTVDGDGRDRNDYCKPVPA